MRTMLEIIKAIFCFFVIVPGLCLMAIDDVVFGWFIGHSPILFLVSFFCDSFGSFVVGYGIMFWILATLTGCALYLI